MLTAQLPSPPLLASGPSNAIPGQLFRHSPTSALYSLKREWEALHFEATEKSTWEKKADVPSRAQDVNSAQWVSVLLVSPVRIVASEGEAPRPLSAGTISDSPLHKHWKQIVHHPY